MTELFWLCRLRLSPGNRCECVYALVLCPAADWGELWPRYGPPPLRLPCQDPPLYRDAPSQEDEPPWWWWDERDAAETTLVLVTRAAAGSLLLLPLLLLVVLPLLTLSLLLLLLLLRTTSTYLGALPWPGTTVLLLEVGGGGVGFSVLLFSLSLCSIFLAVDGLGKSKLPSESCKY